jgi:beta-galactosidase/beta-glucuronidase
MLRQKMLMGGLTVLVLAAVSVPAQETEIQYLSGKGQDDPVQWDFLCSAGRRSGQWTTIGVPSNWELQGFGSYNYGHDKPKSAEQGKYRRNFELPQAWQGKTIHIVFEGVMTDTQVWVNGKSAGPEHQGGFYRFKYDITELVRYDQPNLLEVSVNKVSSNKSVELAERKADYWVFGGIFRPVYLEAFPQQFIERCAVDARADGSIVVDVYVQGLANKGRIVGTVLEAEGGRRGRFSARIAKGQAKVTLQGEVTGIKTWSAETPHLYDLHLSLMIGAKTVHIITQRFGFRSFELRPGQGLFLNGQKIRLKGVNRHSFWPDSGRCLSREVSYDDVCLIKQMNMNAVRMSHYPPDAHFLDACDELGLYVLDELAGWQKPSYDTVVGKKLVREMVTRDVSHPCILFWDNANEGGWNRELDDQFALYDPQQRTVLHPWENFNGIDTTHYQGYGSVRKRLNGSTLFMPTEFLHGLYDGGHGAGLNDYWKLMHDSPLGAGGFLWCLVDEGVVRTDRNGVIDTDGNHAPDGIMGPYREKEASFYTIKEIWSPIHIDLQALPEDFSGSLAVENRYSFTNLQDCRFEWQLASFPRPYQDSAEPTIVKEGSLPGPSVRPGHQGKLELDLPADWRHAHALSLTAFNPTGQDVWTWSWALQKDCASCHQYVEKESKQDTEIQVTESAAELLVKADTLSLSFDRRTGQISRVVKDGIHFSLTAGPRLVTGDSPLTGFKHYRKERNVFVEASYGNGLQAKWKIYPSAWVLLNYEYALEGELDLMGISFDYPEDKMRSMRWVGRGPYRVWKNRTKGGRLGLWRNDYKDHTPGLTWDFPEFRGFYRDWQWAVFETQEGKITLLNGSEDVFLGVYTPKNGAQPARTELDLPATGLSLLHGIPAIGTKFKRADAFGPESQQNQASGQYKGSVCFYFEK